MDDRLFGFDLETTNSARKVIGKKLMDKIPELHEKILVKAKSPALGKYIYDVLFASQLGYAFNAEHCLSYSLIGFQCAYLATQFPVVYWNTACLQVDSGLEDDASTSYGKVAKAIGNMKNAGIKVSLIDINKSQYLFEPDEKNNTIVYGMKSLNGVGGDVIQEIIQNRPYNSLQDFLNKTTKNKTSVISLIKSGAFDQFGERKDIMKEYIWTVCSPKTKLTLQNLGGLIEKNLLPQNLQFEKRLFVFNKALRKNKKDNYYIFKADNYYKFYSQFFDIDLLEPIDDKLGISQKTWQKIYTKSMEPVKKYIQENQEKLLKDFNESLFIAEWNKYAKGNYSAWEMDSLGMYYHSHELKNIQLDRYGIKIFKNLPQEPVVEYTFKRNNLEIPIYETNRIIGTVIAKDDLHSSISILTVESGVVTIKLNRDYFAKYNQRLSKIQPDGSKKVMEQGWFQKGTLVMVNGIRRGDSFFTKKYKKTQSHQLYKITKVNQDGSIEFTNARWGEESED